MQSSAAPAGIRTGLTVLVAVVVAAGLVAAPAPVAAQPAAGWAPADTATISPGSRTVTAGGQCTANFVFVDEADVYLGQAAHCASKEGSGETDGCQAATEPVGTPVAIDGATRPGQVVYSSWIAMQVAGETDQHACVHNDLALVRLDRSDHGRVNPSLRFFGGPIGLGGPTTAGQTVHTYGNSSLRPGDGAPKTGTSEGTFADGWTHRVRTTTNPGVPGDSGSGFVDDQGRAFGVLSTLEVFPNVAANGVSDLGRMLDYLAGHDGPPVTLVDGTVAFDPAGTGADGASGQPANAHVDRFAGATRIGTAVAASAGAFADDQAAAVVLGRADIAADALAGAPVAAALDGPLLLTGGDALDAGVEAELRRVLPDGGPVVLLGGPAALSTAVAERVDQLGFDVARAAGPSRVETSVAAADAVTDDPAVVFVADGRGFAEALIAGPAAATAGGVVLLVDGPAAHPAVDAYLAAHPEAEVVAVGEDAAAAYPSASALTADDAPALSVAVAGAYLAEAHTVALARQDVFADALSGGAHVARLEGPVLLTDSAVLSGSVAGYLEGRAGLVDRAVLFGGTAALADQVGAEAAAAIR